MARPCHLEHPSGPHVFNEIFKFLEKFYQTTDTNTPEAHSQYVNNFTKDAVFIMASKSAIGHGEIMTIREAMWSNVSKRLHKPLKVFPFSNEATEFMLYGTVAYELHDGRKAEIDWAARADLVKEDEEWKFRHYQVYMDPTAWKNAM